jgi:hypothetical protein
LQHWRTFNQAPGRDIEAIYRERRRELASEDDEKIFEQVLGSLSDEYERTHFNHEYLLEQTKTYFRERALAGHAEELQGLLERGDVSAAEARASSFLPIETAQALSYLDPFSQQASPAIREAFRARRRPLIEYPKALGDFWNLEFIRGAFVAFMGREKVGKTFLLLDVAMRAARGGCNVAFFQAGDMTESQQIRRIAIYLAQRSDQEKYCQNLWEPKVDCVHNQDDSCSRPQREQAQESVVETRQGLEWTYDELVAAAKNFPEHMPCRNCSHLVGAPWLGAMRPRTAITGPEAEKEMVKWQRRYGRRFRLSTHVNETLTVQQISSLLTQWERESGWVADVVIIDYADLLTTESDVSKQDFRQQQNRIWQRLRALSQARHCLVVTATQAKATAYKKSLLDLSDYSEDKRKYAHVTAMYGLNQTADEKRIGLMRINALLLRDSDFSTDRPITVLQRLQTGRAILGAFQ